MSTEMFDGSVTFSGPIPASRRRRLPWLVALFVFIAVLCFQLLLVAQLGTDIPINDQWDAEGGLLYPKWISGTLSGADLIGGHNEHRILWTRLIDLALFVINGQWDPLVQLVANAVIHAILAAVLGLLVARDFGWLGRSTVAAGVIVSQLPHVAWGNALCGFQSQVYLVILFSIVSLALLGGPQRSTSSVVAGLAAGCAALFAMGGGAFVPVSLLTLAALRAVERRSLDGRLWVEAWPALVLLGVALALRVEVAGHATLHASTAAHFFNALGRAAAWPHTWMPWAALALNLPLVSAVMLRLLRKRSAVSGEDFIMLIGFWVLASIGAMALVRGGGTDFDGGVTPRYIDFLLLLPVANVWCAMQLMRETAMDQRLKARLVVSAWMLFLMIGWVGATSQVMRRLLLPWARDPEAPVRLAVAFQRSGDPSVYASKPLIFIPHPNLRSVWDVLNDPHMKGVLPPSFQPERPMGSLSRGARALLFRTGADKRDFEASEVQH